MSVDTQNLDNNDPQQVYLDQLRQEAGALPESERVEHEAQIAELAGELALSEEMSRQADEAIQRAKQMAAGAKSENKEQEVTHDYELDLSRIGWIKSDDTLPVEVGKVDTDVIDDGGYFFGSIIEQDSQASDALERLKSQGIADKLLTMIKDEKIPRLWYDIVHGGSTVRPISIGKKKGRIDPQRSLNTTYPAYKIDVQGTNNRAIILVGDEKIEGKPILILAALLDHVDEEKILKHMNLTYKSAK